MPLFQKKPEVVEAMYFDGSWESARDIIHWINDGKVSWRSVGEKGLMVVHNGNTKVNVDPDFWIIRDRVDGTFACMGSTFRANYSPASIPDHRTSFSDVPIGSLWRHTNGIQYRVVKHTNIEGTKPKYPRTVVYQNVHNWKEYSRPLHDWMRSMKRVCNWSKETGECPPCPECKGNCVQETANG